MVKIMIVEDDMKIAELLSTYVAKYGYQGIIVTDFQNVLDIFLEEQPELVLLDINLPSFDGYYWCRQIRGFPHVRFYLFRPVKVRWIKLWR